MFLQPHAQEVRGVTVAVSGNPWIDVVSRGEGERCRNVKGADDTVALQKALEALRTMAGKRAAAVGCESGRDSVRPAQPA